MIIHGKAFLSWLIKEGIVPAETRRVVIDASVDSAVVIYIEKYGTSAFISVKPPPELRTAVKVTSELADEAETDA